MSQGKLDLLVEPMNLLMELAEAAGQVCNACTEKGLKLLLNTSQVATRQQFCSRPECGILCMARDAVEEMSNAWTCQSIPVLRRLSFKMLY